ncbi:UNVERIFIED_CONTAM: hypothetical protein K2H54_064733 [Gekko kuhli]
MGKLLLWMGYWKSDSILRLQLLWRCQNPVESREVIQITGYNFQTTYIVIGALPKYKQSKQMALFCFTFFRGRDVVISMDLIQLFNLEEFFKNVIRCLQNLF